MKFVPEQVETDLKLSEARIDQLLDENQRQNEQIEKLNEKIRSILTFDLLKQRQTQLEEQLAEQCEKTTQLENIFQSETIGSTKNRRKMVPAKKVRFSSFQIDSV